MLLILYKLSMLQTDSTTYSDLGYLLILYYLLRTFWL